MAATARASRSHGRRLATIALALLALASTGCGILAAVGAGLAAALISDLIQGDKKKGGGSDPTVLVVMNDAASTETIVGVDIARVDGAEPPTFHIVGAAPGFGASFQDVFDPGTHWVRVIYASGWRSRAKTIDVIATGTVTITFFHGAPNLGALAGSWFGAIEAAGVGHTYGLTLDANGNANGRTLDGVPSAATGTLEDTSEGVYRVTWSDASVIALIADVTPGAAAHAAIVRDDGAVGVLEKGASSLGAPAVNTEVVGSWSGVQVRFSGADLDPVDVNAAGATVSALQQWEGKDAHGETTSGVTPLVVSNAAFLRFFADAQSGGSPLDLAVGLTPDRGYGVVALTPATGATFPDDVTFQLLQKAP